MSYEYSIYSNCSLSEYAPPPTEIEIHPNSAAAQLGYTAEDMVEILVDQERWYREEYLPELEAETQHWQQQHSNNTQSPPAPTTHIEAEQEVYESHRIADECPIAATSHDDDDGTFEREDSPATWYQPPTTILDDARPLSPPLGYMHDVTHDTVSPHVECHNEFDNEAIYTGAEHDNVTLPAHDVIAADDTVGDWAGNVELELGFTVQSEYMEYNYPPAPSTAPWYTPHPPTTRYKPPWNCDTPPPHLVQTPPHPLHISMPPVPPPHTSPTSTMSPCRKPNQSRDHDMLGSQLCVRSFQS
jgi:hypothetical protein